MLLQLIPIYMAKYSPQAQRKVKQVMHEYKLGRLKPYRKNKKISKNSVKTVSVVKMTAWM